MNPLVTLFIRIIIVVPVTTTTWFVSYFGFDQTSLLATATSLVGGILSYTLTSTILQNRFLKKHRLTRKEYRYIKKNLKEAKLKIVRLNKALMSIRHLPSIKQRFEFMRLTRRIYRITKKEPNRFFQAENFYYSHLNSALELAEKYVFLSTQPNKTPELLQSLEDTRHTLEVMKGAIEKDLYTILSQDIDQLQFEIDFAKHLTNKDNLNEESRNLK